MQIIIVNGKIISKNVDYLFFYTILLTNKKLNCIITYENLLPHLKIAGQI